jgi:Zn-dependent metalloprotease
MKLKLAAILLILVLGFCSGYALPSARQPKLISAEQAKAAVWAFEKGVKLYLRYDFGTISSQDTWEHRWFYYFNSVDCRIDAMWSVDALTGEVMSASYDDREMTKNDASVSTKFSKQKCQVIAEKFARAKYAKFDKMDFSKPKAKEAMSRNGEVEATGWEFEWSQYNYYGAETLNGVTVQVNPYNGRVYHYEASRYTYGTPRKPKITAQEAIAIAQQACGSAKIDRQSKPHLLALPDGQSNWCLTVKKSVPGGYILHYLITIDAETGKVLKELG